MNMPDDEFDDFLRRRKPLFDRSRADDTLEPPAELDRVVLRQAREAIAAPRPEPVYRAPRWSAPLAVAATLAVAFTVVLQLMPRHKAAPVTEAEVSMQNASRRLDVIAQSPAVESSADSVVAEEPANGAITVQLAPAATPPMDQAVMVAPAPPAAPGTFVAEAEAERYAERPPAPILADGESRAAAASAAMSAPARMAGRAEMSKAPAAAGALPEAEYRRDEKTWLAEIARLRTAGDVLRADAEAVEFNRQHRAYAVAPDR